jgi:DNA-binding NtrC family response regulator
VASEDSGTRRVPAGDSFATLLTLHSVRLVCAAGPDRGREWVVESATARIGTAEAVDVRLSDPAISRVHALLRKTASGWMVDDQASTNGLFVDGVRVASAYLEQGSRLRLGATTLQFTPREQEILARPSRADRFGGVLGASQRMRELFGVLERVAPLDLSVLLAGPTGSGKGALARAIHAASPRRAGRFLVLDCANLQGDLVRAELFGHERGAFTGADQARPGVFEAAAGGTVFIDEIGELPLDLQPRLLRALEDREVCRLGSLRPVAVDVRVLAATHRVLRALVREGKFREDLYFRLCVVELEVPPLAGRAGDVPLLAAHLIDQMGHGARLPLAPAVLEALARHSWPGNVRELRNALERGVALAGPGPLGPEHLQLQLHLAADGPVQSEDAALAVAEKEAVVRALGESAGNRTRAARKLGIAVTTLRRKMREYGLE